jgi:hypothetical protein
MMLIHRRTAVAGLLLAAALGCRAFDRGPSEEEVVAAVTKSPPLPPTLGPTHLAEVEAVEVQELGPYNRESAYWPIRVRVKGAARITITNPFQLGLLDDHSREKTEPVEFVEVARLTKADIGGWQVSYSYDAAGPRWRLVERNGAPRDQ